MKCLLLTGCLMMMIAAASPLHASSLIYTLDAKGRLTKVVHANGITISYTYDKLGNRLRKTVIMPPTLDTDGDGTPNLSDRCPFHRIKTEPGLCGCSLSDEDSDTDGVPNCHDLCPVDVNKTILGICGCGVADLDSDNDSIQDCHEECPLDPLKVVPGQCGCGIADTDSDRDATPDCHDECPQDVGKIRPGVCGCGVSDLDSDVDGESDCHDGCPQDPQKIEYGVCGCGVADTDSDGDGMPACVDCMDDEPRVHPKRPEICNGKDDNCNGQADEWVKLRFFRDRDGDGFGDSNISVQECSPPQGFVSVVGDCNDVLDYVHPGAVEVCNGQDDNCQYGIDEGLGEAVCGLGICQHMIQNCVGGVSQVCHPFAGHLPETCDGVLDENCDGTIDEDCSCPEGDSKLCGRRPGACEKDVQYCGEGGTWNKCILADRQEEICDSEDNNCNGEIDEDFAHLGEACDSDDTDSCAKGIVSCNAEGNGTLCSQDEPSNIPETCDGLDNNCDGTVDEGCDCLNGLERPCGTDIGECQPGTQACSGGQWTSCLNEIGPIPEVCDGKDNNCNGLADDGEDLDNDRIPDICDHQVDLNAPVGAPITQDLSPFEESSVNDPDTDLEGSPPTTVPTGDSTSSSASSTSPASPPSSPSSLPNDSEENESPSAGGCSKM